MSPTTAIFSVINGVLLRPLPYANGSRIVSLPGREGTVRGFSGVSLLIIDEASRGEDEPAESPGGFAGTVAAVVAHCRMHVQRRRREESGVVY